MLTPGYTAACRRGAPLHRLPRCLGRVAWLAEHLHVRQFVRAAIRQWDDVVQLPGMPLRPYRQTVGTRMASIIQLLQSFSHGGVGECRTMPHRPPLPKGNKLNSLAEHFVDNKFSTALDSSIFDSLQDSGPNHGSKSMTYGAIS